MGDTVIKLENVSKTFYIKENSKESIREKILYGFTSNNNVKKIEVLKNISFEVNKGEFIGIVGRNGAGKSTLLRMIMGSIKPDKGGKVYTKGKMIRLALGMGFDVNLTARDNIYVNASILGLTFKRIGLIFDDIISFAELENFVDTPIKFYSSGMRSRLTFSIAMFAEADIFLMDEFFGGVGDISFRKKSEEIFKRTFVDGRTILHVSHRLSTIVGFSNKVLMLGKDSHEYSENVQELVVKYSELK